MFWTDEVLLTDGRYSEDPCSCVTWAPGMWWRASRGEVMASWEYYPVQRDLCMPLSLPWQHLLPSSKKYGLCLLVSVSCVLFVCCSSMVRCAVCMLSMLSSGWLYVSATGATCCAFSTGLRQWYFWVSSRLCSCWPNSSFTFLNLVLACTTSSQTQEITWSFLGSRLTRNILECSLALNVTAPLFSMRWITIRTVYYSHCCCCIHLMAFFPGQPFRTVWAYQTPRAWMDDLSY